MTIERTGKKYEQARERILEMARGLDTWQALPSERDLAEQLGVSRVTIRRAIDDLVTTDTLKRIQYGGIFVNHTQPRTEQCPCLCVIYSREAAQDPYHWAVIHQLEIEVVAQSGRFLIASTSDENELPANVAEADGLILMHPIPEEQLPPHVPVVCLQQHPSYYVTDAVYLTVDDFQGGVEAARHLLQAGHRRFAYIGNFADRKFYWVQERFRGASSALEGAELEAPLRINTDGGQITPELVAPLLEQEVTAVICSHDGAALATIDCLHKLGCHIPEEISVIGFDDLAVSATAMPPLTTMKLPIEEMSVTAVNELLYRIQHPGTITGKRIILPMALVERLSCRTMG